jgi:hypothetical protein
MSRLMRLRIYLFFAALLSETFQFSLSRLGLEPQEEEDDNELTAAACC